MTDVNTIARNYIDLWNERAPARRREMLAANWTSDARYVVSRSADELHIAGVGMDNCGGRRAALVGIWKKS